LHLKLLGMAVEAAVALITVVMEALVALDMY
jgi:hypothetical protein